MCTGLANARGAAQAAPEPGWAPVSAQGTWRGWSQCDWFLGADQKSITHQKALFHYLLVCSLPAGPPSEVSRNALARLAGGLGGGRIGVTGACECARTGASEWQPCLCRLICCSLPGAQRSASLCLGQRSARSRSGPVLPPGRAAQWAAGRSTLPCHAVFIHLVLRGRCRRSQVRRGHRVTVTDPDPTSLHPHARRVSVVCPACAQPVSGPRGEPREELTWASPWEARRAAHRTKVLTEPTSQEGGPDSHARRSGGFAHTALAPGVARGAWACPCRAHPPGREPPLSRLSPWAPVFSAVHGLLVPARSVWEGTCVAMPVRYLGQLLCGRHLTTGDHSVRHPNRAHQAAGLLAGIVCEGLGQASGTWWALPGFVFDLLWLLL